MASRCLRFVDREVTFLAQRQIRALLLCVLFISLAHAAPDALPQYGLSIRAGLPLDEALQTLAQQTGIQIAFLSNITAGRTAPDLSGQYTLAEALTRLLKGSGLTFHQVNANTVEVRQAPRSARSAPRAQPPAPPPAVVGELQEVLVNATAEQLVATRVPTPLQEIPQSISVISSEQIREQNSVDLGDVLQNTPGIGVRQSDSLQVTELFARIPGDLLSCGRRQCAATHDYQPNSLHGWRP